jgi:hypothetical protein
VSNKPIKMLEMKDVVYSKHASHTTYRKRISGTIVGLLSTRQVSSPFIPTMMELPIICQLDANLGLFRITRAKGKTLSSGGFGLAITWKENKNGEELKEVIEAEVEVKATADPITSLAQEEQETETARKTETHHYLFVEEVLFLHERGFLECKDISSSESLDSSQLFQMLPSLNMSLAMYFVYSHLRSQDFRVLRHNPDRLEILKRQQEEEKKEAAALKRHIRRSLRTAPNPSIPDSGLEICYDVYMPNSNFSKLSPGLPDFYVAASYYHQSMVSFDDCQAILGRCRGIPLKVASVSDSGTVVMFGLTNFGVPTIDSSKEKEKETKT